MAAPQMFRLAHGRNGGRTVCGAVVWGRDEKGRLLSRAAVQARERAAAEAAYTKPLSPGAGLAEYRARRKQREEEFERIAARVRAEVDAQIGPSRRKGARKRAGG